MDLQSLVQYKKSKRRERAARMAEEPVSLLDDLDSAEEDTDLLKLKPQRPPRPKKVKDIEERLKDPLYEEDIVEGFSFCSFATYEDLDKMAKWSSQHNGKYPDPYSKIKLDEEKKVKKKKKKKDKDKNRDSILSSLDPNTNTKGSSGSSSERGYICDSDSDGDKGSDTGVGDLFRARKLSNVCQNGLSPGTVVKSEPGFNFPLPAVPLPESVARSLKHEPPQPSSTPVTTTTGEGGGGGIAAPAPSPKPFFRPFGLSPPPPSGGGTTSVVTTGPSSSATVTPSSLSAAAVATTPHPAYRPVYHPAHQQQQQQHHQQHPHHPQQQQQRLQNPFFPISTAYGAPPSGVGGHVPPPFYSSTAPGPPQQPHHPSSVNGSYPPPAGVGPIRAATPSSTVTNTVASSHHDLTCKSHLPKLAHALTTTTPSARATPSLPVPHSKTTSQNYPSLPLNDPANLRRELDQQQQHHHPHHQHRYLAGSHENRTLAGALGTQPPPPTINHPPLFGSNPLVSPGLVPAPPHPPHQPGLGQPPHQPSLGLPPPSTQGPNSFLANSLSKDVPKMGGPNSLFAGLGTPPGFPGISPLGVTPPDPLRKSNSSSSLSSPLLVPPPASSSGSNPGPKKTGKWNAMHVRIAWEIYNHQQKQKGSDKKDNPLVPSTSSTSSLAKASPSMITKNEPPSAATATAPPRPTSGASSSSAAAAMATIGQKRPASGAPAPSDFLHKRPATDADLLRSQLFAPPRPPGPPNPLDPLNPLLPRPPYLPPFGHHSPLQSALSAQFPRFGGGPAPFGGLGSLREAAAAAGNPLNFPGLGGSAADPFGLSRPGFPTPSTSLASGWQSRLPTLDNSKMEAKPKIASMPTSATASSASHHSSAVIPRDHKDHKIRRPSIESPNRSSSTTNGPPSGGGGAGSSSNSSNLIKTNGDSRASPLRPASSSTTSSSSPLINKNNVIDHHSKKDDHNEITVVGEKLNHVPNGGPHHPHHSMVDHRPGSSSHNIPGKYTPGIIPGSSLAASSVKHSLSDNTCSSKNLAASLARPPITASSSLNPFGLAALYSGAAGGLGGHPPVPPPTPGPIPSLGLPDPYRDPYRSLGLGNPYLPGSRESMLRLNQLMMTDAERIRMGLTAAAGYPPPPHHAHTPGLYGPPTASPSSLLGAAKPPTGLPGGPPLGYPPGFPPGFGAAVSAASLVGLPPSLNGHAPHAPPSAHPPPPGGAPGSSSSHHHPLR